MTAVKQINIKIKSWNYKYLTETLIVVKVIKCLSCFNSWDFITSLLVIFGCLMHSLYNVSPSLSLKQLTVEQEFKNISSCKICNFPLPFDSHSYHTLQTHILPMPIHMLGFNSLILLLTFKNKLLFILLCHHLHSLFSCVYRQNGSPTSICRPGQISKGHLQ